MAVVRDTPFGAEDTLFSGSRGMVELIVPNGTWIRAGNSTQIQFIALETDLAEMDVASGVARFYNKGSGTVIRVTSPFGYVLAYPGTVFDFYVGDNSVEVVAVKGRVSYVHSATEAKYDVAAGSPSILADQQQVSSAEGTIDPDWDRWNKVRENFWAAKARVRGRSVEYLPPGLQDEAYALEENGRWERVPYEGTERWFWRPRFCRMVALYRGPLDRLVRGPDLDSGRTLRLRHPPLRQLGLRAELLVLGPASGERARRPPLPRHRFLWSPGRVSWIHSGAYVGWVLLAPRETYYSHRHWGGRHDVVVTKSNFGQINIHPRNYAYANRAIVVPQKDFYRVNNYREVRVPNVNRNTILNDYRAAPVVNNTVIDNYTKIKQRYNYTNVKVEEKPHNAVIKRIQQNETIIHEGRKEKASLLQDRVKAIPEGRVNREARIEAPRVTNYIVPASEVNRPKSEIKLQQKEIRSRGEVKPGTPPGVAAKPVQQPAARPERVAPARPSPPEQPGQPARPERVSPVKPAPPERVAPARPSPPEQPGQPARPERVSPAKPAPPERAAPARPSPPEQPGQPARPERVSPAKPAPAERVAPARPSPPEQPGQPARPERVSPAKPAPPASSPRHGRSAWHRQNQVRRSSPVDRQDRNE